MSCRRKLAMNAQWRRRKGGKGGGSGSSKGTQASDDTAATCSAAGKQSPGGPCSRGASQAGSPGLEVSAGPGSERGETAGLAPNPPSAAQHHHHHNQQQQQQAWVSSLEVLAAAGGAPAAACGFQVEESDAPFLNILMQELAVQAPAMALLEVGRAPRAPGFLSWLPWSLRRAAATNASQPSRPLSPHERKLGDPPQVPEGAAGFGATAPPQPLGQPLPHQPQVLPLACSAFASMPYDSTEMITRLSIKVSCSPALRHPIPSALVAVASHNTQTKGARVEHR